GGVRNVQLDGGPAVSRYPTPPEFLGAEVLVGPRRVAEACVGEVELEAEQPARTAFPGGRSELAEDADAPGDRSGGGEDPVALVGAAVADSDRAGALAAAEVGRQDDVFAEGSDARAQPPQTRHTGTVGVEHGAAQ